MNRESLDRANAIVQLVCSDYATPIAHLADRQRRDAQIFKVRVVAAAALRRFTKLSLLAIGDIFCRDHSTIINQLKVGKTWPWLPAKLAEIERSLVPFKSFAPVMTEMYGDGGWKPN